VNEETEEKINRIAAKTDIIESVNRAIMAGLLGDDCLTEKIHITWFLCLKIE